MNIYKIINIVTDKIYVGQTKYSIEKRFGKHKKNAQKKVNRCLYDSMNRHGLDNFVVELIETTTIENADAREIFWISKLNSQFPLGYNMTKGGGGGNTLAAWAVEEREALYKRQGAKRTGKRAEYWRLAIAEANKNKKPKTLDEKKLIAEKISKTNKARGITFPKTVMYGKDNPNFVDVNIDECRKLMAEGLSLKQIAEKFGTTSVTVGAKIKASTGKTFTQLRKENGTSGPR